MLLCFDGSFGLKMETFVYLNLLYVRRVIFLYVTVVV
jgi:hypothetical protein